MNRTKSIIYKWGDDSLLIELGNRTEQRIQVLFWGEFLFTTGMATILLLESLPAKTLLSAGLGLGSAVLYVIAAYRFFVRMFSSESVLLEKTGISLIKKTLFSSNVRTFAWEDISPLFYYNQPEKTDHPLKGNSFDYFGFDTHEYLLQNLHHEGNLFFNYHTTPIHFARGVYSWNAEEMVNMMKLYAGEKLRLGPELERIIKSEAEK